MAKARTKEHRGEEKEVDDRSRRGRIEGGERAVGGEW